MKSKNLRKIVFRKYKDGDGVFKIFRDLNSALVLNITQKWCRNHFPSFIDKNHWTIVSGINLRSVSTGRK